MGVGQLIGENLTWIYVRIDLKPWFSEVGGRQIIIIGCVRYSEQCGIPVILMKHAVFAECIQMIRTL